MLNEIELNFILKFVFLIISSSNPFFIGERYKFVELTKKPRMPTAKFSIYKIQSAFSQNDPIKNFFQGNSINENIIFK